MKDHDMPWIGLSWHCLIKCDIKRKEKIEYGTRRVTTDTEIKFSTHNPPKGRYDILFPSSTSDLHGGGGHIYLWTDQPCIQTASLLYSTKINFNITNGSKTISGMLSKLHTVVCVCMYVLDITNKHFLP
jgi:hypothetical protein